MEAHKKSMKMKEPNVKAAKGWLPLMQVACGPVRNHHIDGNPTHDVHHIDGNPMNDHKDNLEMVTHKEHMRHHLSRPINVYSKTGKLLHHFEGIWEAKAYFALKGKVIHLPDVSKCISDPPERLTHAGMVWKPAAVPGS